MTANTLAEEMARKGHKLYEALAPDYGYETRRDTQVFDPDSPNGKLMIAVYGEIIDLCNQAFIEDAVRAVKSLRMIHLEGAYNLTNANEVIEALRNMK